MEQFTIEGGHPLTGEITCSGNKNAALPLLAACLLTDQPVTLRNMPDIRDVRDMKMLMAAMGAEVENLDPHTVRVTARQLNTKSIDPELCRQIRASILVAGPSLARVGQLELPPPGGDIIGRRRLDTHMLALTALGADIRANEELSFYTRGLRGADILLDEASVTGTENAIMAAVMAEGKTVLRNAASEPHVQDLCNMLVQMGARIDGIGSNTLRIEGVHELDGADFAVGADYIEAGSYIVLAAVTGGAIRIHNAAPEHLGMVRLVFSRLGVHFKVDESDVIVPRGQELTVTPDLGKAIPKIDDAPWPAFPADLMSVIIVLATQTAGTVLIHEKMYESRLFFVDKLNSMGAQIVLCDPHRCIVNGPVRLRAEKLESPDIRAGIALLIAALAAPGTSRIRNVSQIDRGYERIEQKLKALGAYIERQPVMPA